MVGRTTAVDVGFKIVSENIRNQKPKTFTISALTVQSQVLIRKVAPALIAASGNLSWLFVVEFGLVKT
jgi:hypothetical protein